MEKRLSKADDLGYTSQNPNHIKVALTTLAFNSEKEIEFLRKRGKFIKKE